MKHVKYGGSTAARTMGCAAWLNLAAEVPPVEGSNPAADEGTMLHNCMEEIYRDNVTTAELIMQGREHNGQSLTHELVDSKLLPAIECVEDVLDRYYVNEDIVLEPYVQIDEDMGGSIDLLARSVDRKTIVVLDYKFGYNSVEVVDNKQLLFYALNCATDPQFAPWFDEVEQIVLAIVQPNGKGEDLSSWVIGMDEIDAFETEYLAAVEASEDENAVPTAGPHCQYCPAHATCPVKTGAALKVTRINELTADKLAEYLPLADEVTAWAKEVHKLAHEQLSLGTPIDGYKLVDKRASRVWNDKEAVEDKVRKAKKIKLEDGFTYSLKSPAQLEKVCKTLKVDFKQYEGFISSVSSGTTLAKADDKRPAALPLAGLEQLNEMN